MEINRETLEVLKQLYENKELVPESAIPVSLMEDFKKFFFGKTYRKNEDGTENLYYSSDVSLWISHLFKNS